MPVLKSNASQDILTAVQEIETRADDCWRSLSLLRMPANVAAWGLLTGGIARVEREQAARGSGTQHFHALLANLGRLLSIGTKWAGTHAPEPTQRLRRDWSHEVEAAVEEALAAAAQYSHFENCLQGFHKDCYAVDVINPNSLRFTVPGTRRDLQVSAYQKGFRSLADRHARPAVGKQPDNPRVHSLAQAVLDRALQTGRLSFEYGDAWDLWLEMLPEYRVRISSQTRRAEALSLGDYSLGEFSLVYAALVAVCAAHDFLCFRWGQIARAYPIESAVIVRPEAELIGVLARLSGVSTAACTSMIADLTFSARHSVDLHVYPVVRLAGGDDHLVAVAPPFPLHGRHDENMLRVCSQRRPKVYDLTSVDKEAEMLAALRADAPQRRLEGPVRLPPPTPDIDLLMVDEASATVVIAELKWIRKTVRPAEIPDRNADVLKGIRQLQSIRSFLTATLRHLVDTGRLSRPLDAYDHVYYLLVARDHWRWVEPDDSVSIVEFEAFSTALSGAEDLRTVMVGLLTYEWLPVEGRDFVVRLDKAEVNGVAIESPVFYSTAQAQGRP